MTREVLDSQIETLEEVCNSSKYLMAQVSANHQDMLDFCYALRFLLKSAPGMEPLIIHLEKLIAHMENLRIVATSYHKAVSDFVEDSE